MRHPDRWCPVPLIDCQFGMLAIEQETALVRPGLPKETHTRSRTHTHTPSPPMFWFKVSVSAFIFPQHGRCCRVVPGRCVHPGLWLQDYWSVTLSRFPSVCCQSVSLFCPQSFPPSSRWSLLESARPPPPSFPSFSSSGSQRSLPLSCALSPIYKDCHRRT